MKKEKKDKSVKKMQKPLVKPPREVKQMVLIIEGDYISSWCKATGGTPQVGGSNPHRGGFTPPVGKKTPSLCFR